MAFFHEDTVAKSLFGRFPLSSFNEVLASLDKRHSSKTYNLTAFRVSLPDSIQNCPLHFSSSVKGRQWPQMGKELLQGFPNISKTNSYAAPTYISHSLLPGSTFRSWIRLAPLTTSRPLFTPFALSFLSRAMDMSHRTMSSFSPWMQNVGTLYFLFRTCAIIAVMNDMNDTGSSILSLFDIDTYQHGELGGYTGYTGYASLIQVVTAPGGHEPLPCLEVQVCLALYMKPATGIQSIKGCVFFLICLASNSIRHSGK